MKFGQQLSRLRKERKIRQNALARLAGFSPAMLSLIERGHSVPTDDTAERFMEVLGLDADSRTKLLRALAADRGARRRFTREPLKFGTVLNDLLTGLGKSSSDLISQMDRPTSTVNAYVAGTLLPGDDKLVDEIFPALTKLGACEVALHALKLAHLQDVLARSLNLKYLTKYQKEVILCAAKREAEDELRKSD
jgi:transcriptional regulator with XRE-family HTH domain